MKTQQKQLQTVLNLLQLLRVVMAALMMLMATQLKAELGETVKQFEPGRPTLTGTISGAPGFWAEWIGHQITHYGYFVNGHAVQESFWFNDHRELTRECFREWFEPYREKGIVSSGVDNESRDRNGRFYRWGFLKKANGELYGVEAIVSPHQYRIYRMDAWDWCVKNQAIMGTLQQPSVVVELPQPPTAWPLWRQQLARTAYTPPQPTPQPTPTLHSEDDNDCMIVATKEFNKLGDVYWKQILRFNYTANGQRAPIGHAIVVWKRSDQGHVHAYDKEISSADIDTTSTDINEILSALASVYSAYYGTTIVLDHGRYED